MCKLYGIGQGRVERERGEGKPSEVNALSYILSGKRKEARIFLIWIEIDTF
jgi:hypothetical protein